MSVFTRFRAISENDKAAVVRKLMESSTPDFDFFYLIGLSMVMATMGLLLDSVAIVIGSMLIAPLLYPVLGVALGLTMSHYGVFKRSLATLGKSFGVGVVLSTVVTLFFADETVRQSFELMNRTEVDLLHFLTAVVAGAAVSFTLGQSEWSETVPGIAISVALIPPLAVVGVGIALFDFTIISGAFLLLMMNVVGIIFAAMVTFSLMNLYEKQHIAESTIEREDERLDAEKAAREEVEQELESTQSGVAQRDGNQHAAKEGKSRRASKNAGKK